MVFQNYQNLIEMISNIIDVAAFGVGIKCPRKIHLNTLCPPPLDEIGLTDLPKTGGTCPRPPRLRQACVLVLLCMHVSL